MPLPRLPSLRGEGCSSNCWGSGARGCRGEVAEAVSGGDEIEIAPMVADVTASRFHVMGVVEGRMHRGRNLCVRCGGVGRSRRSRRSRKPQI